MGNLCNCFPKDDSSDMEKEKKKLLKQKQNINAKNFEKLDIDSQIKESIEEEEETAPIIQKESKEEEEEAGQRKIHTLETKKIEVEKKIVVSAEFLNNTDSVDVLGAGREGVDGAFRWHAFTNNFMRLTESGSSYTIENKKNLMDFKEENLHSTWVITEVKRELKEGIVLYYFNENSWEAMDDSYLPVPTVKEAPKMNEEKEEPELEEEEEEEESMSELEGMPEEDEGDSDISDMSG